MSTDYTPPIKRETLIKQLRAAFETHFIENVFGANPNADAPYNLLEDELIGLYRDGRENGDSARETKQTCNDQWRDDFAAMMDAAWDNLRDEIQTLIED